MSEQHTVPLYREIDALGGTGTGEWHAGYVDAISEVLNILDRRGFSEALPYGPVIDGLTLMQWSNRLYDFGQEMPEEARDRFKDKLGAFQDRLASVFAGPAA